MLQTSTGEHGAGLGTESWLARAAFCKDMAGRAGGGPAALKNLLSERKQMQTSPLLPCESWLRSSRGWAAGRAPRWTNKRSEGTERCAFLSPSGMEKRKPNPKQGMFVTWVLRGCNSSGLHGRAGWS